MHEPLSLFNYSTALPHVKQPQNYNDYMKVAGFLIGVHRYNRNVPDSARPG